MKLKELLFIGALGLGVYGLEAKLNDVCAEEQKYKHPREIHPGILEEVNDKNYYEKVLNYEGAVIVLMQGTLFLDAGAKKLSENMQTVFEELYKKFVDAEVNGLPIKFLWYDAGHEDTIQKEIGVRTNATIMYGPGRFDSLKEKELDRMCGGTLDSGEIEKLIGNMTIWINLNLVNSQEEYTGLYNCSLRLLKVYKR